MFYDNTCNSVKACNQSNKIVVFSGSCNDQGACQYSPSLTVGSDSCNGNGVCANCCGKGDIQNNISCENYNGNGNIVIPNGECNYGNNNDGNPFCPWCPMCKNSDKTSCYKTQLTGQATLSNPDIPDRRALQTKKSKQKDKKSKGTPMNCESAKDKIVSFFQGLSIAKLRSKYTIGELAKNRKRSRDCNVKLSWLFEHLEGYQLVQACAELENQKPKLQAYIGNSWNIQNLKCTPEDKNKIR